MSPTNFAEIDFTDGYQVRLEHQYDEKYDSHRISIKRQSTDPDPTYKNPEYSDVNFFLDTPHFKQFCNFFNMIGENNDFK